METKNSQTIFDAKYKAVICYNLACSYQMQGELNECSKYLTQAIELIQGKLDFL